LADGFNARDGVPVLQVDPVSALKGRSDAKRVEMSKDMTSLGSQLETLLSHFQQPASVTATGMAVERVSGKERRLGSTDEYGRVRAIGRRKESAARVWLSPSTPAAKEDEEGIPGRVLVNALPLPTYFHYLPHREVVVQPLTLTSSLGAFNIFAIAKGGGLAAQADAVALAIAKALVEWERCQVEAGKLSADKQEWRDILKKGTVLSSIVDAL
jgi:ribosomal protein S9